ncbi:EcsC family protein [Paenibacillus thermoaerophilus]|uniref:EcsC family protein n=1 Tax=Paenibacillus thermoaerophilus TaxID=1215385 RepID=A0ABW2V0G1_9BACL|nr:EcsC family protein [Paenibacillus thermoaerophilus]TMV11038.1 EcsC family protein [Paenibacillus thermoaerophilus]
MNAYESLSLMELKQWEKQFLGAKGGMLEQWTRSVQNRMYRLVPPRVDAALTAAVKGMVRTVMTGIDFMPKDPPKRWLTLKERDGEAARLLDRYKKIAAAEGAGTGAGGIMLGLVDFPALIAIKMRFLFELAHLYGFDTRDRGERLFALHVFQLAFSSANKRREVYERVRNWDKGGRPPSPEAFPWDTFQREYRDAIDFRKMLQLLPGIGAVVGAWANYGLLEELGGVAIRCYRWRRLEAQG